jgi:flavorubredoxin
MPTQVQTALGTVMRAGSSKKIPCGVFGSFGWSGEAVDMMEAKLKVSCLILGWFYTSM